MAENVKEPKLSLKSSKQAVVSRVCTLKSPNFFAQFPGYIDDFFEDKVSPSFEFADATWQFRLECLYDYSKLLSVCLERLNYKIKQQKVFYTINLQTDNGEEYKERHSVCRFNEDEMKTELADYSDEFPFHDRCDTLTLIIYLTCHETTEGDEALAVERDADLLSCDFKKLLKNGKNYDLTLRVSDKELRVHQDILMARSQVFEAMLSHNMREKHRGIIDMPDCDSKAMEQFLLYVYSGNVEALTEDNVRGLYYIADKYNMTILKEKCTKYTIKSLSPTTICDVIQFASNHSDSVLLEGATAYFVNNTSDIFSTGEWKSFLMLNVDAANELLVKSSKKWATKS